MTNENSIESSKWYHYPIVWFMLSIPAVALVSGFAMLYFALSSTDIIDLPPTLAKHGLAIEHKSPPKNKLQSK